MEHRTVIIIGGGPAGLPLSAVLGGWHPYFRSSAMFAQRYGQLDGYLRGIDGSLLGMDMEQLVRSNIPPGDLFRLLHHPRQKFETLDQLAMEFRQGEPLDYLLISREEVGGLWNNVPQKLLTLSPGQWMEFAFYPLAEYAAETGLQIDVNDLVIKHHLLGYYHSIPERFGQRDHIHTGENVEQVEPHERGFLLTARDVGTQTRRQYTCKYLVYAAGQRCVLRRLDVPGEELPFVTSHYDKPEDFPGEHVLVVGGGRSADWAATELHDAGKQVHYVMRQSGLPYYTRIAQILEAKSPRLQTHYNTQVRAIGEDGQVEVEGPEGKRSLRVDHLIKEIGGVADYSIFKGFAPLQLEGKYDNYRFQVDQVKTRPHNYEALGVDNLYMGGYLAAGIGLVVIGMHGTTYAIAADILQKEGRF